MNRGPDDNGAALRYAVICFTGQMATGVGKPDSMTKVKLVSFRSGNEESEVFSM